MVDVVVRNESVRLTLHDDFSTPMAKVAASTALANHELRDLDGAGGRAAPSLARVAAEANRVPPALDSTGSSARRASADINQYSGRLSLLVQGLGAIAPAALPIGAVAVPAISGFTNALGAAGIAVGTGILAFKGLGDAMKAMDKAAAAPTVETLAAANEKLQAIAPSARQFALELNSVMPVLGDLQQAAGQDMFPGLSSLLDGGLSELPRVKGLLEAVGGAVGNLGDMTGDSLRSGQWSEFLDFLKAEVPSTIESLGRSAASLAGGMAELWMAFQPTNNDFNAWLEDTAQSFQDWSTGLSQTEGFREFIDYIEQSGPQVAAAAGAIGNAGLQIIEAFAPLGGPTLRIIETFADLIGTIADSPIGTPLAAIATALSTLSLLNKGLQSTQGLLGGLTAGGGGEGGGGGGGDAAAGIGSFFQENADQVKDAASTMQSSFVGMGTTLRQSLGRGLAPTTGQMMTLRSRMGEVGRAAGQMGAGIAKGGAPLAAMALLSTGAAEDLGVTNAATLAMAGSMAGPWGAAVGAGAGLLLDFKASGDAANEAMLTLNDTLASGDATAIEKQLAEAKKQYDDLGNVSGFKDLFSDLKGRASANLSGGFDEVRDSMDAADQEVVAFKLNAMVMGPVLDALAAGATTTSQRASILANSIHGMDDALLPVAERAKQAKQALDDLLSPSLNLAQATDQYRDGLRNISESLNKNNKSLKGNTDAASQNRDAVRTQVRNLQALFNAQADSGASGGKLTRTMRDGRQAILDAGTAAGISKGEMRDYLTTLGLTPKTIKTLVSAETSGAMGRIRDLQNAIAALHDKKITITQATQLITFGASGNAKPSGRKKGGPQPEESADGSTVPKTGKPYADRHLYLLADGEEVVSNRYGQADRHRPLLKQINANLLADGGTTGDGDDDSDDDTAGPKKPTAKQAAARRKKAAARARARRKAVNAYADLDVDTGINSDGVSQAADRFADQVDHLKDLVKDAGRHLTDAQKRQVGKMREAAKEYDRLTAAVQATREAQAAYASEVAGSINNDIFGNGLAGAQAQLDADSADNNAMLAAITAAVSQGLDGPALQALAASGDLTTAQQLAASGAGGIASFEASFGNRVTAQQALGQYAGQQVFGAEITKQTNEVVLQTREIRALRQDLKQELRRMGEDVRRGSEQGTKQGNAQVQVDKQKQSGQQSKNRRRGGRGAA